MQPLPHPEPQPFSSLDFLPPLSALTPEEQPLFEQLLIQIKSKNTREQLRTFKKLMEQQQNPLQPIIHKHLGLYLLAQFTFGNTSLRHQVLDLMKNINITNVNIDQLLQKLNSIDHYRNISELLDKIQSNSEQFRQLFYVPLMKEYIEATKKIESENFSCKWLQTYLEIIRAINNCLRYYQLTESDKDEILLLTKRTLRHYLILRRDVLNHLYIILLTLHKQESEPDSILQMIHYLHAKSVLYSEPILNKLLKYTIIPETETKYHLIYVFQYALEKQIVGYQNKEELFTAVIDLYEIGRSAYGMIEAMLKVLINEGCKWKLDGYLSRNFFIVKVLLKCSNGLLREILAKWPEVIKVSLEYSGNLATPFAIDCLEEILLALYEQNKNFDVWINTWYQPYLESLLNGEKLTVKGIIQQLNPVIVRVLKKPILLQKLLNLEQTNPNKQLGIISLLQCHKQQGMIAAVNEQKCYIFKDYTDLKISYEKLSNLLVSNQPNISCKALEFITVSLKLSEPVVPFEFDLIFEYIKYSLGTNSSEYRHRYTEIFRKFFERIRGIYEKQLSSTNTNPNPNKRAKVIPYFNEFKQFIFRILSHCSCSLYPQVPFQIIYPILELWLLVLNYFGVYQYQIKKGNTIQGCNLLKNNNIFTLNNFTTISLLLRSSFENIRSLALNILYHFPNDFELNVGELWNECIGVTNKLIIREFESGSRLLAYMYEKHEDKLQDIIQNKHQLKELNLYYYLLNLLKQRFQVFKQEFIIQTEKFYQNLIHGIITTLSLMFDKLTQKIKKDPAIIKKYSKDIELFLVDLFNVMIEILNFAVDISGTNVSTVVLDSTQSVNRINNQMKIDCRGHFYQNQKEKEKDKNSTLKNLDSMLSGSSLMTALDDEENPAIENTLVVSFYLVSKELGLIFNSIVSLVEVDSSQKIIPEKSLISLINVFFYALINLKHMGSIDRISKGLEKMSKVLYKKQNIELISIPENLLKRLLELLQNNEFTNTLRRSAGVPYAFTCLLKSDALKKRQLVTSTMTALFKLTSNQNENSIDARIHAFNILKKLFQDSDLKFELDPFVSQGFIRSIKGFGTEDWGVRNSSLMLFSALALRTLGPKPRLNLIQFFKKCPTLIQFFQIQLKSYIENKVMYPPIYPIALLLSRMIPFDQVKSPAGVDSHEEQPKQIHRNDFNKFIPLLQQAGNTPNCMGRIIIAKALFPFMELKDILPFCLEILSKINVKGIKSNHNKAHSQLMNIYQLLNSYYDLLETLKDLKVQVLQQSQIQLLKQLYGKLSILKNIKCAFVKQIFTRIIHKVFSHRSHLLENEEIFKEFILKFRGYVEKYIEEFPLLMRFKTDLGDSTFRITLMKTYLKFSKYLYPLEQFRPFESFFNEIINKQKQDNTYMKSIDYQLVTVFVNQLINILQSDPQAVPLPSLQSCVITLCFNPLFQASELPSIYRLFSLLHIPLTPLQKQSLITQQQTSLDPNLKVAIFQLLKQQVTLDMLMRFTDPEQLTALRGCVVEFIQTYNPQYDIVYIRLLDDEDNEIRKETAHRLSASLKLGQMNQNKIKQYILNNTKEKIFILNDTDVEIKKKNFDEERIFSYDKANRYRSDIYNIVSICGKLREEELKLFEQIHKGLEGYIEVYERSMFSRNEYYFELILKSLVYRVKMGVESKESLKGKFKNIDPILERVIEIL